MILWQWFYAVLIIHAVIVADGEMFYLVAVVDAVIGSLVLVVNCFIWLW